MSGLDVYVRVAGVPVLAPCFACVNCWRVSNDYAGALAMAGPNGVTAALGNAVSAVPNRARVYC